ncbi:MAG TPA: carboxypeptidase-like regulatory domain-containing protein [Candidatus Acidoferrum sp.]|nr:carboxypeptidase-like regulatory domain-containing protein [Candidatus Acidoferrum sp.]
MTTVQKTLLAGASLFLAGALCAQEPAGQAPSTPSQPPAPESSSAKGQTAKGKHSDDFLVRGTVFDATGLALPGAELRIRRSSEKKFRWDTVSNSRGNFAVRVKMGADYVVVVRAKGFDEQAQPVDAKTGDRFKDIVFRMTPPGGKK